MRRFEGKKVLVTGGSRGLGFGIAKAFAAQGADVMITYRTDSKMAEQALSELKKYGGRVNAIKVNVVEEKDRAELLKTSYAFLGDVDIVVNNAGIVTRRPFLDLSEEEIQRVLTVNFLAPFFVMQAFGKCMVEEQKKRKMAGQTPKDYCFINITSISREVIIPDLSHYEASKAALNQLTKSAGMALAQHHIRVNDVAPGLVPTDLNQSSRQNYPSMWKKRVDGIPLHRTGAPEEVGQAVLAAAENKWMTGTTITVDGGRTLNWLGEDIPHDREDIRLKAKL